MKIAVFCAKGSTGKTPISFNIFYDLDTYIVTNEPYNILDDIVSDKVGLTVGLEDEMPKLPDDIDVVFDLAGAITRSAASITTAIKQSDVVIVPINNEYKALKAGILSIAEVISFDKPIIVVATKLEKARTDKFKDDWTKSTDFKTIDDLVKKSFPDNNIPVMPLKKSSAFDTIFEQEKSVKMICRDDGFLRHSFALVALQFDKIYEQISKLTNQTQNNEV